MLLTKESIIGVDKWALFYKSFFIYSDMDYDHAVLLKEYLFGFGRHPKHLTITDKFTDFRKFILDSKEDNRLCRFGLVNTAKDSKDVLAGELGEGKDKERFVPKVYLPHKEEWISIDS